MIESFFFLRPLWLLMLLPIAALVWLWVRRTREDSSWQKVISRELLQVLVNQDDRKLASGLRACMLLACVIFCLAIAGPTWEKLPQKVEQTNDALVIVLDLSLSMLAQDIAPSRIDKARQKIVDVLRQRDEGVTGLVAFAGDAHIVVPLTDDSNTIENLLVALHPQMMPVLGSNVDQALELSKQLLRNSALQEGRILLITDGISSVDDVTKYRDRAFPISIIGVGTAAGGPIPISQANGQSGYLSNDDGQAVTARFSATPLIQAAQRSHGAYADLSLNDGDIQQALSVTLPSESDVIEIERQFDAWNDQGYWLALLLIPLMLAAFRRGLFFALPILIMLPNQDVFAAAASVPPATVTTPIQTEPPSLWQRLWSRPDQLGYQALKENPGQASQLFEDPQWRATAHYRNGDWGDAFSGFESDPSATGQYNQGNALARLGDYPGAIDAYDRALTDNPNQQDAAHNKALVEALLEQQNQQQQQGDSEQQSQQQSQQQSEDSEQQQDDEADSSQQDGSSEPTQDSAEPPEPEETEDEARDEEGESDDSQTEDAQQQASAAETAVRDEKQEALEQWLRRVPDDPGGLLRRKFQHESKQRLREGDYRNRQDQQIW